MYNNNNNDYNRNSTRNNRSTYNYRSNNKSYDKSDNRAVNSNESNAIGANNKTPVLLSNYNVAVGVPAVTSLVAGLSTGHPILGAVGMIPAAALGDILYYKYNKKRGQ